MAKPRGHALTGTKTGIIAAAVVTDRNGADNPQLQPLLEKGAEVFDIARLCADKAYSGGREPLPTCATRTGRAPRGHRQGRQHCHGPACFCPWNCGTDSEFPCPGFRPNPAVAKE